jgi:hypothetical protein
MKKIIDLVQIVFIITLPFAGWLSFIAIWSDFYRENINGIILIFIPLQVLITIVLGIYIWALKSSKYNKLTKFIYTTVTLLLSAVYIFVATVALSLSNGGIPVL